MKRLREFEPCIPKRGTKVPAGPDWIHEIKHYGYRLIVQREGARVRLFTRNGYDCSHRYPLIVEAALRNRATSYVIDGKAVLLGVDGISDFNGLHSRTRYVPKATKQDRSRLLEPERFPV
jgi:bifunctional non-homologous end joining protein LigD